MMETRMKTHDCSRQGRQGYGGLYDDVPNVEMKWANPVDVLRGMG